MRSEFGLWRRCIDEVWRLRRGDVLWCVRLFFVKMWVWMYLVSMWIVVLFDCCNGWVVDFEVFLIVIVRWRGVASCFKLCSCYCVFLFCFGVVWIVRWSCLDWFYWIYVWSCFFVVLFLWVFFYYSFSTSVFVSSIRWVFFLLSYFLLIWVLICLFVFGFVFDVYVIDFLGVVNMILVLF